MYDRENALKEWLVNIIPQKDFILTSLTGDASFRRYFRIQYNGLTQIVMDAPPGKEDLGSFVHVAQTLAKAKVVTPTILAMDLQQGFLLLSDFGDELLLGKLQPNTVDSYYHQSIRTLFKIQECPIDDLTLPSFDKEFMLKEMYLCNEWFFNAYLNLNLQNHEVFLIKETMEWIASEVSQQPLTFIHRDYHSRNLMIIDKPNEPDLGVIDFQDAMCGPLTYDLVSLLKDCYISWSRDKIMQWVQFFYEHNTLAQTNYSLAELFVLLTCVVCKDTLKY